MDADRFDAWTRALRSRRATIAGLAGGLALVTAFVTPTATLAAPCGPGKQRCKGRCIRKSRCCTSAECKNGTSCKRGACRCPAGQRPCGDQCLGKEGTRCTGFETCCSGSCDFLVGGGTCSSCRGHYCDANYPCCPGTPCLDNRCGGCLDRAVACTPGGMPCCFSDCANIGGGYACLSQAGGRCKHDANCAGCYFNSSRCAGACVEGVCQV